MAQYNRRPVTVDAMQFTGSNSAAILAWAQGFDPNDQSLDIHGFNDGASWGEGGCIIVATLNGQAQANPTDWIVRDSAGNFWPMTASVFTATYV